MSIPDDPRNAPAPRGDEGKGRAGGKTPPKGGPPAPPVPDPDTPIPDRPPVDLPPEGDRPTQLPAPKGTIRSPVPGAPRTGRRSRDEAGKVGAAILMWLLGVPGGLILLYLLFWG